MLEEKIRCETTQKGFPALWESGGGYTNTGEAQIICASDGAPKKPIYIRRRGQLANKEHALFAIKDGDVVITANHHRDDFEIVVYAIWDIDDEEIITDLYSPLPLSYDYERKKEKVLSDALQHQTVLDGIGKVLPDTVRIIPAGEIGSREYITVDIFVTRKYAYLTPLAQYSMGEWDNEETAQEFAAAIAAAKEKATCYHCREPHYYLKEE